MASGDPPSNATEFVRLERLLVARRNEVIEKLQGLDFGTPVTLLLNHGETRGRLRSCDGNQVVFIGGRRVPISEVTGALLS